jgi:hypothetical protein
MFCSKCGASVTEGSKYCHCCGTVIEKESYSSKYIQLICKRCNGTMQVEEGHQVLICPFCGAKEMLFENDDVIIEKVKNQTVKEVELSKLRIQNDENKRDFKKWAINEFSSRPLLSIGIGLTVISLIFTPIRILIILGIVMIFMGSSRKRKENS